MCAYWITRIPLLVPYTEQGRTGYTGHNEFRSKCLGPVPFPVRHGMDRRECASSMIRGSAWGARLANGWKQASVPQSGRGQTPSDAFGIEILARNRTTKRPINSQPSITCTCKRPSEGMTSLPESTFPVSVISRNDPLGRNFCSSGAASRTVLPDGTTQGIS